MRVLVISNQIPALGQRGNQVVSFHRISYLALTNKVVLICFGNIRKSRDKKEKHILEQKGITVYLVKWKPHIAIYQLLKAVINPRIPFQCALFKSKEFQEKLKNIQIEFSPDLIYSIMIRVLANDRDNSIPIYVDMVDSMGLNFSRRLLHTTGIKRWILAIEQKRVSQFEKEIAKNSVRSFVVSNIDKDAIGIDNVNVIPLGVDLDLFKKNNFIKKENIIIFTGNMFYQPNVDAVLWFIQNCWDDVKSSVPSAKLIVVGDSPAKSLLAIAKKDKLISITGRVPSIVEMLNTAKVSIAPMQSGSGMQFKILEAMACGVPVVASSLGLGDISAINGESILVADTPVDFTQAVLDLLQFENLSKRISSSGVQYVHSNHDWLVLNTRLSQACGLTEDIHE